MRPFVCGKIAIQGYGLRHAKVWRALFARLRMGAGDTSGDPEPALAGPCAHSCPQAWERAWRALLSHCYSPEERSR